MAASPNYVVAHTAYLKLVFHAAAHPHAPVCGVLLGSAAGGTVTATDAIPLLHTWTHLAPAMEISLDLAENHAAARGKQLVGFYFAADDRALAPTAERVASRLRDKFADAFALVIDGTALGSGAPALIPFLPQPAWRAQAWGGAGARFALASPASAARALELVRVEKRHRLLADFDDHLDDVGRDWLTNAACADG